VRHQITELLSLHSEAVPSDVYFGKELHSHEEIGTAIERQAPRSAQAQQCPGRKRSLNGDVSREARRRTTLEHSDGAAIGCDDPRAQRDALYAK
jgi:hypothetical protein